MKGHGMAGRERMLQDIQREAEYTRSLIGKNHLDPRVMEAMASVPRERFVPAHEQALAYADSALPLSHGQTISQPFIVALMTDLLAPAPGHRILEVGTGSGYQTAVLARLVQQVYSIEIIPALADSARQRLASLGVDNVTITSGNGCQGWPEHAPYDGIIVTAAASEVPPPLVDQLKPGGRLVIPVGEPYFGQDLMLIQKDDEGHLRERSVLAVAFVPLVDGRPKSPSEPLY